MWSPCPQQTCPSARRVLARAACLALTAAPLTACAPPFSELQSARLAGMERLELTPSYARVTASDEGESETTHSHFGLQVATGVSEMVDLRGRFERVTVEDEDDFAVNVIGFGPKLALVRDRVAFYVPIGFAFGEDIDVSETLQIHPTLLATLPLTATSAEVNGSAKVLVPITERDVDTTVAFNLGLGLGDLSRWVIRPEVGFLFSPGESGHFRHISIGVTWYAGS